MPVKKTVTETVETPEDEHIIDEFDDDSEETALDGLLSEFMGADNVVVNVYRQEDGKNLSFVFKTHPEEMTGGDIMERCQLKFGTGDYRMHVREGRRLVANRAFSVVAPKDDSPKEERPDTFGTSELMALMTKQNEQMQTLMLGTMTALANAFANKGASQPTVDPIAMQNSVIQGIATMKELADGNSKKEPGAVEMLIKGVELSQSLAPKTGETNTSDILLKGLEMFPVLAQAGTKGQPAAVPGNQIKPGQPQPPALQPPEQPANPAPEQTPISDEEKERREKEMFFMQARGNLAFLCKQAQENKDPELYAELVLDQMGREKTLEFLGKPDALEQLAQIDANVMVYQGWFIALRTAILDMTREEDESEPVPNAEDEQLATVVSRIDQSGLRREGQQGAPVVISGEDGEPDRVVSPQRSDGNTSSDT